MHDKGRDCARTDQVLENYRRRAIRAERALIEHGIDVPADDDAVEVWMSAGGW